MPKRTRFPTIDIHRIRHLIEQAEILDAEDAAEICLNCGHPSSDHDIEHDTCGHSAIQDGKATICDCKGWSPGGPARRPVN